MLKVGGKEFAVVYFTKWHDRYGQKVGYVTNSGNIYWYNGLKNTVKLISTDGSSFVVLDDVYAKDSERVFCLGKVIKNSDSKTFQTLGLYYAKDKHQVYFHSYAQGFFVLEKQVNPKYFVSFGKSEFGSDQDNLYFLGKPSNSSKYNLRELQNKKFEWSQDERIASFVSKHKQLSGYWWAEDYNKKPQDCRSADLGYLVGKKCVYTTSGDYGVPELVMGIESKTFSPINTWYCRDREKVFCGRFELKGVDAKSFKVIENKYAQDNNFYFFLGKRLKSLPKYLNPVSKLSKLKVVDKLYALNEHHVLVEGRPVKGSDPKTFKKLSDNFAQDKNLVYWKGYVNKVADSKTLVYLFSDYPNDWAKDKRYVYNANGLRVISGLEGKIFVQLNKFWGKDKKQVFSFYTGRVMSKIDPKTFRVKDSQGLAEDKYFTYSIKEGQIHKIKKK